MLRQAGIASTHDARTGYIEDSRGDSGFRLQLGNVLLAAFLCICKVASASAEPVYSADGVKAAYLYHFAGYVDWPAETSEGPLVIGVIGDHGVAAELQHILPGRTIQGRAMQVREINLSDTLAGIHVVYAGAGNVADLPQLANAARQRHILLVSEASGGLELGAAINFVNIADRIRFEISLRAAEEAELKISSRLLSAALRLKRSRWNPYDNSAVQLFLAAAPLSPVRSTSPSLFAGLQGRT